MGSITSMTAIERIFERQAISRLTVEGRRVASLPRTFDFKRSVLKRSIRMREKSPRVSSAKYSLNTFTWYSSLAADFLLISSPREIYFVCVGDEQLNFLRLSIGAIVVSSLELPQTLSSSGARCLGSDPVKSSPS